MIRTIDRAAGGRPGRIGKALLLALSTVLLLAAPMAAKSWSVSNFRDTITVNPDGSVLVSESITLVFVGEWRGIHRMIPIESPGTNGAKHHIFIDAIRITDENGAKLKFDSATSGAALDLKIDIPNAVDATRTIEVAYRVRNGMRPLDGTDPDSHDEFYWNVTGNDWPVPIDHAAASVHFPVAESGSLRAQAFTGIHGSTERDATTKVEGANVEFEANSPLPIHNGLTIDVYISKGALKRAGSLTINQIKRLVEIQTPDSAVAGEIRNRGLEKTPDEEAIEILRRAGAGPLTLEVMREKASHTGGSSSNQLISEQAGT
jgi:hypothetical protein